MLLTKSLSLPKYSFNLPKMLNDIDQEYLTSASSTKRTPKNPNIEMNQDKRIKKIKIIEQYQKQRQKQKLERLHNKKIEIQITPYNEVKYFQNIRNRCRNLNLYPFTPKLESVEAKIFPKVRASDLYYTNTLLKEIDNNPRYNCIQEFFANKRNFSCEVTNKALLNSIENKSIHRGKSILITGNPLENNKEYTKFKEEEIIKVPKFRPINKIKYSKLGNVLRLSNKYFIKKTDSLYQSSACNTNNFRMSKPISASTICSCISNTFIQKSLINEVNNEVMNQNNKVSLNILNSDTNKIMDRKNLIISSPKNDGFSKTVTRLKYDGDYKNICSMDKVLLNIMQDNKS